MKRTILFSVVLSAVIFAANGTTITATPGSLESELKGISLTDDELKIKGEIDVRDLRALAEVKVATLDMSGAKIVAYSDLNRDSHGQSYYRENLIPQYTFFKAPYTSVTLPSGTVEIGAGAFADSDLKSVTLPSGLRTIGEHAFYGCSSLTSVTLPSSVSSIGVYAFANDTALKEADLSRASLTALPANLFAGCSSLSTVTLPLSLRSIGSHCFDGTAIKTLNVDGVTNFADYALAGMSRLVEINFAPGVTFGNGVLMDDTNLQTIVNAPHNLPALFAANCSSFDSNTLMSETTSAGDFSLANTMAIELILSPGLTSVGAGALRNVETLERIDARALGDNVPEADETAFVGIDTPSVMLHVADNTENVWKEHPVWGRFNIYTGAYTGNDVIENVMADNRIVYENGILKIDSPLAIERVEVYSLAGALLLNVSPMAENFETTLSTDENMLVVRVKTSAGLYTYKLLIN